MGEADVRLNDRIRRRLPLLTNIWTTCLYVFQLCVIPNMKIVWVEGWIATFIISVACSLFLFPGNIDVLLILTIRSTSIGISRWKMFPMNIVDLIVDYNYLSFISTPIATYACGSGMTAISWGQHLKNAGFQI